MEQNNTLLGLVLFIAATLYTINLVKRRKRREKKNYPDYWDASMYFRGLVGGIAVMIGAVILLVKQCGSL
ncbi:hypothetical protein [Chryseobacterium lacus]|uniref:hypothetical protein n=1 Tax=Chryseobacterium lacus TaxID=2058346 RepID=UPI000F86780F|nr:hypothetical protein [Chryseobacterium lacus]RST28297.1 hypothetical protein EIZ46_03585 [Chryseobacterium lacus]